MKRIGILIAAFAAAVAAAPAFAQAPGQFYFGASGGVNWSDGASPYGNTLDDSAVAGGKAYFGYMWSNLGLEIGGHMLGKYESKFANVVIAETKPIAATVSAVYVAPLGGGYTFHGKVGIAFTQYRYHCVSSCGLGFPPNEDTKKTGLSGMWGLGVDAGLGRHMAVRVDYEHFGSVHEAVGVFEFKDAYDTLNVGLMFAF